MNKCEKNINGCGMNLHYEINEIDNYSDFIKIPIMQGGENMNASDKIMLRRVVGASLIGATICRFSK
ncbi:MAG TPA: hypothetical protein GXX25_10470 [Desulfotomaculum sp.]|nr:hypothetical protein [Desulfotomaculum sp.]